MLTLKENTHGCLGREPVGDQGRPLVAQLGVVGINHRHAEVELRGRVAVRSGDLAARLQQVHEQHGLNETVILSTCNRTEIYFRRAGHPTEAEALAILAGDDVELAAQLVGTAYSLVGTEVVAHAFRVASGLDSLVVGETQILGQMKRAYEYAQQCGSTGLALDMLFQTAFRIAKDVRTQTALSSQHASVPGVALDLVRTVFDDPASLSVAVIGTGEMARVTLSSLVKRGARKVSFISRSAERARTWAERHAQVDSMDIRTGTIEDLPRMLSGADVVVACTSVEEPIITRSRLKGAIKGRSRPLLVLDLGLPRNVAPEAGDLSQVFLHDIDGLQVVVNQNLKKLEKEMMAADAIVTEGIGRFVSECRVRDSQQTARDLRETVRNMAGDELARVLARLPDVDEAQRREMEELLRRVVGKVLHQPLTALRAGCRNGNGAEAIAWTRRLFGLDG